MVREQPQIDDPSTIQNLFADIVNVQPSDRAASLPPLARPSLEGQRLSAIPQPLSPQGTAASLGPGTAASLGGFPRSISGVSSGTAASLGPGAAASLTRGGIAMPLGGTAASLGPTMIPSTGPVLYDSASQRASSVPPPELRARSSFEDNRRQLPRVSFGSSEARVIAPQLAPPYHFGEQPPPAPPALWQPTNTLPQANLFGSQVQVPATLAPSLYPTSGSQVQMPSMPSSCLDITYPAQVQLDSQMQIPQFDQHAAAWMPARPIETQMNVVDPPGGVMRRSVPIPFQPAPSSFGHGPDTDLPPGIPLHYGLGPEDPFSPKSMSAVPERLNVMNLFASLFTALLLCTFVTPIYLAYHIGTDRQVQFWIGGYMFWVFVLPPIYVLVHLYHLVTRKPAKLVIVFSLIGSCVLLLIISDRVLLDAYDRANEFYAKDCDTFVGKRDVQREWDAAHDFYAGCMKAKTTELKISFEQAVARFRLKDCKGYLDELQNHKTWTYLADLEEDYHCSGWCTRGQPLWTLSEVKDSCAVTVADVLRQKVQWCMLQVVIYTILALGLVSTSLIFAGPSLWGKKKRKMLHG